jgi:hypothetical protein
VENKITRVLRVLKRNGYPDWWYELQAKKKNHSVVPNGSTGKLLSGVS